MSEHFNDLYIFEMANNHQGSEEHGLRIIAEMGALARKYALNAAVKLQYRDLDTFIHPDYKDRADVPHVPRFMSTRLTARQFARLIAAMREAGLLAVVTPFDEASVATCLEHDVDIIKVASCSADDWPLLERVAAAGKPVIISTGGRSIQDIDNIYSFFGHRNADFALMHCVGVYPTPPEMLNLNFIDRMRRRYPDVPIGYSGHEAPDNVAVGMIAKAKHASILERHVGVPTDTITLNGYSMSPEQTEAWVVATLEARTLAGDPSDKVITEKEIQSLQELSRGVFALGPIKKGEALAQDKVFFAMPPAEGQLTSGHYSAEIVASRDYAPRAPIMETAPVGNIRLIRTIIHEFRGMFNEAGIRLGDRYELELSHHLGMEKFRKTGALIVNLINREYCKKLIALLPGQKHPQHAHRLKEETFQVLWGDLQVTLNGRKQNLEAGDMLLVQRGDEHSFESTNGVIFEEISTTHHKGDSNYEDPRIQQLDPIERKTVLEEW